MESMIMTTFDFSPLYSSSIGFDRLAGLMDAATQ
ncbi:MAG: heat-shock protein IbpA, partial [Methylococcus sp.]